MKKEIWNAYYYAIYKKSAKEKPEWWPGSAKMEKEENKNSKAAGYHYLIQKSIYAFKNVRDGIKVFYTGFPVTIAILFNLFIVATAAILICSFAFKRYLLHALVAYVILGAALIFSFDSFSKKKSSIYLKNEYEEEILPLSSLLTYARCCSACKVEWLINHEKGRSFKTKVGNAFYYLFPFCLPKILEYIDRLSLQSEKFVNIMNLIIKVLCVAVLIGLIVWEIKMPQNLAKKKYIEQLEFLKLDLLQQEEKQQNK